MKFFAAALAALSVMGGAASAQFQYEISNPSGIVRNFDIANVGPVFTALGLQWETSDLNQDGNQEIKAVRDGIVFFMVPAACQGPNNTNCFGAQTFALFTSDPVNQQTINAFNAMVAFVSTGPTPQGYYVSRYDIADFGIARGNVESSLDSFHAALAQAQSAFVGGGTTVSTIGYADDLAAARLNEASARALGVEASAAGTADAGHLRAVEQIPEAIKAFAAAAGESAFNKIDNIGKK